MRRAATACTGTSDTESVGTRQEAQWIKSIGDDVSATVSDTDRVVEKRSHSVCKDKFGWNAPFPRRTKRCSGIKQRDHRQFALLWNSVFLVNFGMTTEMNSKRTLCAKEASGGNHGRRVIFKKM